MIMTNTRKLTGPIIDKGSSTKFLVFFVHGWGSDGNDLIQIGEIWKSKLQLPMKKLLSSFFKH